MIRRGLLCLLRWLTLPWSHFIASSVFAVLAFSTWQRGDRPARGDHAWFLVLSLGSILFAITGAEFLAIRDMLSEGDRRS